MDRSVIGALFDHRDAEWTLLAPGLRILDQGMVADAVAQRATAWMTANWLELELWAGPEGPPPASRLARSA